jgi:predicted KAP-like P-loop ATPase
VAKNVSPQKLERALSVAAIIASNSSDRGTLPSDKLLRQICLTGLRIVTMMDTLAAAVDEEPAILTASLDDWAAYKLFEKTVEDMAKKAAAAAAAAEAEKAAATAETGK